MHISLNKRNSTFALATLLSMGLITYQCTRANANQQRVESVILNDQNIQDEYGEIKKYHIENMMISIDHTQSELYHYDLAIIGDKKSGGIALEMQKIPEQDGYRYSIQ
jgi:hypothetical protein